MDGVLEASCTFSGADGSRGGDIREGDPVTVIFLYKCKHGLYTVLVSRLGGHVLCLQGADLFDQEEPDLREDIPGLKFTALLLLDESGFLKQGEDLSLRRISAAEFDQAKTLVLCHGSHVFGFEYTFKMSAQKDRMKQMGAVNHFAGIPFSLHGGKDIRIDEIALPFVKMISSADGRHLQRLPHASATEYASCAYQQYA